MLGRRETVREREGGSDIMAVSVNYVPGTDRRA
jgi:hypothetical protein